MYDIVDGVFGSLLVWEAVCALWILFRERLAFAFWPKSVLLPVMSMATQSFFQEYRRVGSGPHKEPMK